VFAETMLYNIPTSRCKQLHHNYTQLCMSYNTPTSRCKQLHYNYTQLYCIYLLKLCCTTHRQAGVNNYTTITSNFVVFAETMSYNTPTSRCKQLHHNYTQLCTSRCKQITLR